MSGIKDTGRFKVVLPVVAALGFALAVFACGGGDDGTSSDSDPLSLEDAIVMAAENEPVQGSVTQGSDGINGITQSSVNWDNSASEVSRGNKTATSTETPTVISGIAIPSSINFSHYASSDPEVFMAQVVSGPDSSMVGGIWAEKNDLDELIAFGAFADGAGENNTPASAVPADGTYSGDMVAFYNDNSISYTSYSKGTVTLTVSSGSVSGTITSISASDPETGDFKAVPDNITVTLSSASKAAFFSGNSSAPGENSDTASGKWGGEFYGTSGEYIGGTVGMTYGDITVIGAFLTSRNSS